MPRPTEEDRMWLGRTNEIIHKIEKLTKDPEFNNNKCKELMVESVHLLRYFTGRFFLREE